METIDSISKTLMTLINIFSMSFVCFVFFRVYIGTKRRIDTMSKLLSLFEQDLFVMSEKINMIYINQLIDKKKELIETEQYEKLMKLNDIIEREKKLQNERIDAAIKRQKEDKKTE